MPNTTTNAAPTEMMDAPTPETTETTETTERPSRLASETPAPTRKTREKARPVNFLVDAPVKSMSDKEKTLLIEHYKLENNRLAQQVESYRNNAEAAFEKARMFENCCNDVAKQANLKFNDIIQAVSVMYKTINLIAKDGTTND